MLMLIAATVTSAMLLPGTPVTGMLTGQASATLTVSVDAPGQFVAVNVVEGADVSVAVSNPRGERIAFHEAERHGTEHVVFIAPVAGLYTLTVTSLEDKGRQGRYEARLAPPHPATDADRTLIEAEALSTRARAAMTRGDEASVRESIALRRQELDLLAPLPQDGMRTTALTGIGDALYRLGQYEESVSPFEEALALARRHQRRDDEAQIANNLALSCWRLGDVGRARDLLSAAVTTWRAAGSRFEGTALNNLGIIERQAGAYDAALRSYDRALAIHRRSGNRRSEAFTHNNRAVVLDALGRTSAALLELRTAIVGFRALPDERAEGRALILESQFLSTMRRLPEARAAVERGLQLVRTSGDRRAEAEGLERLGRVLLAAGEPEAARVHLDEGLTLYRQVASQRGVSDALDGLGLAALARHKPEEALARFEEALSLRRSLGVASLESESLGHAAEAAVRAGQDTWALEYLEQAISVAEQIRGAVFERELRTSYTQSMQRLYDSVLDLLVRLHDGKPDAGYAFRALQLADRLRARTALERLRAARATSATGTSGRRRQQQLSEQMSYWAWQLWEAADRPGRNDQAAIHARLASLSSEIKSLESEQLRQNPRAPAFLQPIDVPASDLQSVLQPDDALLAFHLGAARSYLWVVTAGGVVVRSLPERVVIERSARTLTALLQSPSGASEDPPAGALWRAAARLSRQLFPDVSEALTRTHLFVVPEGALTLVPFGVLRNPQSGVSLVDRASISILPSVSLLPWLREQKTTRAPSAKLLAAIGDPVFSSSDPRVTITTRGVAGSASRSNEPVRLPFSRAEIDRIVAIARPASVLRAVDFDAHRALFLNGSLAPFRYIHVASHAIRDDRQPELSGIMLSLVSSGGVAQNGFVRLQDIYNIKLSADLVVLSACETGIGRLAGGEGLTGLAEGFFHAGSLSVIASLWKVDDEATAALMAMFYQSLLQRRVSPAEALRQAQLAFRGQKRWADPYFWSGWIVQGLS